jgi:hypothetical protein
MTTHEQPITESREETQTPVSDAPGAQVRDEGTADSPEPPPDADPTASSAEASEPAPPKQESSVHDVVVADDDLAELRARWAGVQAAFVDDPKDCVHQADVLVSDLFEQLTTGFAQVRSRLEEQWSRGEEASTEDLRLALMRYREFFERLLAV